MRTLTILYSFYIFGKFLINSSDLVNFALLNSNYYLYLFSYIQLIKEEDPNEGSKRLEMNNTLWKKNNTLIKKLRSYLIYWLSFAFNLINWKDVSL